MPIYLYEILGDGEHAGETFEYMQKISDPALEQHPETGEPVRKIITPPALVLKHGEAQHRALLSDKNIAAKGFTRYEKTGDGTYERTAGSGGPKKLQR
ncbi:MAG TPA: FmdB family transcriptional regulator [Myxococcales bacterium]|nr:FmdB family transcriptional regulator [Deltaproteobacteria bacterium]MBU48148.1 FmdB family transcriptional regulator [Deltaproteobacteria bacterium]HAA57256.1 FmdB family transcriptional regulator [Myxococcales bacterium]|tara:strand:+ start:17676 stop:17969 length:294 start_codon:yes stop_codon:yes gene_type:complete